MSDRGRDREVGISDLDRLSRIEAICKLGLGGIVSKKLNAAYHSGPSRTWIKVKNPKAPAATRGTDGTF